MTTRRPKFPHEVASAGVSSSTNMAGELSLLERVAALERAVLQAPQMYVGAITITSGTGSQSFTGWGLKPRLVLLFGTVFGDSASVGTFCVGTSDGTTERSSAMRVDSTDGQRVSQATLYTVLDDNDSVVDADGSLTSFDADGMTINKTTSAGASLTFSVIALS